MHGGDRGAVWSHVSAAGQQPIPRVAPASVGLAAAPLDEATALLKRFVDEQKIAGAVAAVARKGKLAYLEAVGVQDLETRAPMTERSLFRIYSMTKPVTAVAVMMLQEAGRFSLADPVSKYLPEFKDVRVLSPDGRCARRRARSPSRICCCTRQDSATARRNSTGRRAYASEAIRCRSSSAKITHAPLMEDPGTRFRYSEGTTVLGRLVEIWSGKPFDTFLEERIFRPLGMTETGFWVRPEQRSRLARVYQSARGGGLTAFEIEPEVPFTERPTLLEGAVGLVSTVPDFLRFSQMLLNRGELNGTRILAAKTVDMMTVNGLPDDVLKARGGTRGWGLGNVDVALETGEYGWDGTAGTIFTIDPRHELITILMWQSVPADPDGLRAKFKALVCS